MSDIVVFNVVTDAFREHIQSTNADFYQNRSDVVIYHDSNVPAVEAIRALVLRVQPKYLRHDAGTIREMTQAEKDQVNTAEAAALLIVQRDSAKAAIDDLEYTGKILRAIVLLLIDELNILRTRDRDRATDVSNATNFADLKARWALRSALNDRTPTQARNAIKAQIDAGTADT